MSASYTQAHGHHLSNAIMHDLTDSFLPKLAMQLDYQQLFCQNQVHYSTQIEATLHGAHLLFATIVYKWRNTAGEAKSRVSVLDYANYTQCLHRGDIRHIVLPQTVSSDAPDFDIKSAGGASRRHATTKQCCSRQ